MTQNLNDEADKIMDSFLSISKDFSLQWKEYISDYDKIEKRGIYNDFAEYARYIVTLFVNGKKEEIKKIMLEVDRIYSVSNKLIQEAIIAGLLEDIEGGLGDHHILRKDFLPLLPEGLHKPWKLAEERFIKEI